MNVFRRETHLAPGDPTGPDGWRPTTERTRVTDRRSPLDVWGDRALWAGVSLATAMTASLTAWSAAELLAGPYGQTPDSNVWRLGFGLGLVADILWLIMLLLVRRARAVLRTNSTANKTAWGFAGFSVALIAGHALVDGASVKTFEDFDLWTFILLTFAAFPILTKILWSILFDAFYLTPDPSLAKELDKDARRLLADQIRWSAEESNKRQRMLIDASREQFAKELGLNGTEPATRGSRVELTRDTTARHDTTTPPDTTGHDTKTRQDSGGHRAIPPRPTLPPATSNDTDDTDTDRTRHDSSANAGGQDSDRTTSDTKLTTPADVTKGVRDAIYAELKAKTTDTSVRDICLKAYADGVPPTDTRTLRALAEAHYPKPVTTDLLTKSRKRAEAALAKHIENPAGEGFFP